MVSARWLRFVGFAVSALASGTALADPSSPTPSATTSAVELEGARAGEPSGMPKLTFDEAIARALANNPSVRVADKEIQKAEALVTEARSTWVPTLTANASYTRLDHDRVIGGRVLSNANQLGANLVLVVPIVHPRGWAGTARASEGVALSKLSAADARRQVAVATGRTFLTVIAQRRVLESSINAREQARAHERYAKERLDGGIGNRLDFVRAAQERAVSETRVAAQMAALVKAQEALGVLLGQDGPADAIDATLPRAPSLTGALRDTERRRTDVIAQKQRVEIARKAVRDDYTEYMPQLSATAQPFYQNPATPVLPQTGWQAQILLSVPLYDGGKRSGLAGERAAIHDEAKTQLEAMLRQARADVRTSFEALRRADLALEHAREAQRLAEESLELSQIAYRAGATTNIEVIDAERSALDASTSAAIAEDAARQARLEFLAASGRFP